MPKIKGIGVAGVVKALRARRREASRLLPPPLRRYLDERIAISRWYPEADYLALLHAYVKLWPERTWEGIGVYGAKEALSSVYRNIVVEHDVPKTAARMRVNWRNYHDTGDLVATVNDAEVRVQVRDYEVVSRELCRLNTGYFGELLARSGARVLSVHKLKCTADGDESCIWQFRCAGDD